MIRIRFMNEDQLRDAAAAEKLHSYTADSFYSILRGDGESPPAPPFRDAESLALLHRIDGAVPLENDWYSVQLPYGRSHFCALSDEVKYGLTVLSNSRKGIYTTFVDVSEAAEDCFYSEKIRPSVWDVLGTIDMEVYIAFPIRMLGLLLSIPIDVPFLLENHLEDGREVEAWVSDTYHGTPVCAADGRPQILNHFSDRRYRWTDDIDNVRRVIGQKTINHVPLCRKEERYSMSELNHLLGEGWTHVVLPPLLKQRSDITVVNHMLYRPCCPDSRRPVCLRFRFCKGIWTVEDEISTKWPDYEEHLYDALCMIAEGKNEQWLYMVLDVNELLDSAENFAKTVYGFAGTDTGIELLDAVETLRRLDAILDLPADRLDFSPEN